MARRDAEAGGVFLGTYGSGAEKTALFRFPLLALWARMRALHDLRYFFAAEDADDLIDAGDDLQQFVLLPLGEAPGDDDGTNSAQLFQR